MEQMTVNLEREQAERVKARVRDGRADSQSEAMRQELRDSNTRTSTGKQIDRVADVIGIVGITMLGVTFTYPLELRVFTIVPLVASIICYSLGRVIERSDNEVISA